MPLRRAHSAGADAAAGRRTSSSSSTSSSRLPLLTLSHLLARLMFALLVLRPGVLTPQRSASATAPVARAFSLRMMSSGASGSSSGNKLRVVTYNILTPHYSQPRDLPVRCFCCVFYVLIESTSIEPK